MMFTSFFRMVDMDSLKNVLAGGGAFVLLCSVLGQVSYSGLCASNDFNDKYMVNYPGRYGAYYQLSLGIAVMGAIALVFFLVYLVFTILELSFLPDIVLKIIGLVGVVFWFGMFIAECCAIDWAGPSSVTTTRKAIANDETVKYGIEHFGEFDFYFPDGYGTSGHGFDSDMLISLYELNTEFDKYSDYDEYNQVGIPVGGGQIRERIPSPCLQVTADESIKCIGGWSKNKLQKYFDASVKRSDKEDKEYQENEDKLTNHKITVKDLRNSNYPDMKNMYFYTNSGFDPTSDDVFIFGMFYSEFTSIFLGCQIVGIIILVCSIVLGFIGGSGGSPKENDRANKSEEV